MNIKLTLIAAIGSLVAFTGPASAVVTLEGLAPLSLSYCVPQGAEPFANQPAYRRNSDRRPTCVPHVHKVQPKAGNDHTRPAPRKPAYQVPQK